MGGRPAACCRGFPSCYFHTLCRLGGVAGWNMNTGSCGTGSARCWVLRRHLPVGGLFFLVAAPGLDRLTHPCVGCGGGCGGFRGVVVC